MTESQMAAIRRAHLARVALATAAALVILLGAAASTVLAVDPAPTPAPTKIVTTISISGPASVTIGGDVSLDARLTTATGTPIAGMRLVLGIRSVDSRTSRTGADGVAQLSVPSDELSTAGTLPVSVTFDGDGAYLGTTATTSIEVKPASVQVVTVPAVPGVQMSLGQSQAATDASGVATFLVDQVGRIQLVPDLELPIGSGLQVSFVRWEDDIFDAARIVNVQGDQRLVLGLRTAVQVSLRFVDPDGRPIDSATVESVTLVAASGEARTLTTYNDVWLEAAVPAKRTFGLVAVTNLHRISDVTIAGTNVVNRGQQTFEPAMGGVVTVQLLLYDLSIRAEDALLRWPVETDVRLEFPDGTVRRGRTDADGEVVFSGLPRGDYTIRLSASGIVPPSPIALSRPQDATIRVISTLDLSIGGAALLLAIAGLVLLGRRHQVRSAAGRARGLAGDAASQAAVATSRSDRTARALFDSLAQRAHALRRPDRLRSAPRRPDLDSLRARAATIANAPWAGLRGLTDEQRLRLLIVGVAVVGIGLLAAVAATIGLPPVAGNGSATPSPSVVAATPTPRPTPGRPTPGVAALRSVIQLNGYLTADRLAIGSALGAESISGSDLADLLRQVALHARLAGETLQRAGQPVGAEALITSLAGRYRQVESDASAALSVRLSDTATYEANAAAIASSIEDLEPLTIELQALADQLAAATEAPFASGGPAASSAPRVAP